MRIMICGIDEAGRGPVIGPLVIAGVLAREDEIKVLASMGVKDSKKLTKNGRNRFYKWIIDRLKYRVIKLQPVELDGLMDKINLNEIEALKFAELINELKPKEVYIDSASANANEFKKQIFKNLTVEAGLIVEHKADERYPIVSAASIVAKVIRDEEIERLCRKYGDFGSGYPADPRTINFLNAWFEKNRSFPDFVRKKWKTLNVYKDKKISDFI